MTTIELQTQMSLGRGDVFHCGDGIATAQFGHVFVAIWRDAVIESRFNIQRQGLDKAISRYPDDSAFLCLIEESAKPPDEKLRRASYDMVNEHRNSLKCVACVIEGSGFKAATARSVLSGMVLLSGRREPPLSVFATVNAAGQWMNERVTMNPDSLVDFVENMRSRLALANQNKK